MGNWENIYVLNNTLTNNDNIGIDFNGNTGDCKSSSLDQPIGNQLLFLIESNNPNHHMLIVLVFVQMEQKIFIFIRIMYSIHNMELKLEQKATTIKML